MNGKKMQVFVTAKEASQLSNSNEEGPVYYKTILLPVFDAYLTVQFRAMTMYFHNFKVSPIYPMNEGSYHREISDEQEKVQCIRQATIMTVERQFLERSH